MLIVVPLLGPFTHGPPGRALRTGLLQAIGILLATVLIGRLDLRGGFGRLRYLAFSGVNAPITALLLWVAFLASRTPDQAFAVGELLRLATGAVIYFAVALHLESRAQLRLLLDCLVGMTLLLIGYGLIHQGGQAESGLSSLFRNRHHLSAVLTVLFPLLASLALGQEEPQRRLATTVAAVLCLAGLLLCLERSAWVATIVGFLVWLCLASSRPRALTAARPRGSWRAAAATGACALLLGAGFFAATDVDAIVSRRAKEIPAAVQGREASFTWRVQKWRGAAAMALERPLLGWGPGQFVLHQQRYTRLGSPEKVIREYGASFDEMAYNEYLQTAVELGFPGLALYLSLLAAFFSKGIRALGRLPDGMRRATLLGCMAAVAAQMVDSAANGSWRYAECSIFFWLVLSLGVAVIRMAYHPPSPASTPTGAPV